MVQSGKSFLAEQKRLKAAAKRTNIPGTTDVEEQTTSELDNIEKPTEESRVQRTAEGIVNSKIGQKMVGLANTLGDTEGLKTKAMQKVADVSEKIVNSKAGQSMVDLAEKIPDSKLSKTIEGAKTTPSAQEIKETSKAAIEGAKGTQEERDILLGEGTELKKKYSFFEGASKFAKLPIIKSLPGSKAFVQAREDYEKNTYLSNGAIVIKEPTLQEENGLQNAKNLAASITYAYITKGEVVDAKTVKEKIPVFEDVSDDVLNKYIGGILYSYITGEEVDREYVAEKYGDIVKSDNYLSKKQAIIDLFLDNNTWTYGLDEQLSQAIEEDPELQKVIQAYQYLGLYGDWLENNGYNQYGSTTRGLAQSYQDEELESEGGMSLKEAYKTASEYNDPKLNNLIEALSYNLQKTEKYAEREYNLAMENPLALDAIKFTKDAFKVTNALLHDFSEYNVESWSESGAAKYTPLGIADIWLSGRTFTDSEGNIRNRDGKVVFERHSDGTYTNAKGENVTKMLKTEQGLLKSLGNHLEGLGEGIGGVMKGVAKKQSVRRNEGYLPSLQYDLQILAGMFDGYFNAAMLSSPTILSLEATPVTSEAMGTVFSAIAEFGALMTQGFLEIANLENNMDPENVEAAIKLGESLTSIMFMNKVGKKLDPYKKSFLEAKDKVFNTYRDRMVQMMGRDEMNNKIKKERLPDKTKEETIVDGEKTVAEIRQEQRGKTVETKQEVVKKTPAEKMEVKEPTQREEIDITPTKDKLGYIFQINRAVISDMVKDFNTEFKKALDKNLPEGSVGRALYDMSKSDVSFKEQLQTTFGDIGMTAKDFVSNATAGLKSIRDSAKQLPKRAGEKISSKRANTAYDKMRMSDDEIKTINNNPLTSKLGDLLHKLIGSRRGQMQPKTNMTAGEIAKYIKDSIAKDRVKEQLEAGVKRLQEWSKFIHDKYFQGLSNIKNIDFSQFFLGENGIKRSLRELIGETDADTYIRFRMVDGKIVMEYKKGYSKYYDDFVKPKLEELVNEYNDMLENGKISEQNISKLNDIIQDITYTGKSMRKSQDPQTRREGEAIENAGKNINASFNKFLEETGIANNLLVGKKAQKVITDILGKDEGLIKDLMTNGKIDESKAAKFLEGLSEQEIADLEALGIKTSEYIDLMKNGTTALEKIYNFQLSVKEMQSVLGNLSRKAAKFAGGGMGKFGTLVAVLVKGSQMMQWLAGLGIGLMATAPGFKGLGKLADKTFQRNLKKALDNALKNPRNEKQLNDMLNEVSKTVDEIDQRITDVINKWTQTGKTEPAKKEVKTEVNTEEGKEEGPNRKPYDTSTPNREEYDPNAPIFRNGEEKQQSSEQRDNDMVVSEQERLTGESTKGLPEEQQKRLTDERQYLGYEEDPETQLNQAMADLEIEIKTLSKNLKDMIDDDNSDDGGDGGDGGNGPITPNTPDTKSTIDTIDDFIKFVEGNSPVEKSQGEDKPDFKTRSNESLNKLLDKDGNLKEGVPPEYEEEILNELYERALKKDTASDNIKDQNTIIRRINEELDKVADHKRKDIEADEFEMDIRQVRGVDQHKAYDIFTDIVDGKIQETDITQKKTIYEDNQEAAEWIKKRTGEKTTPTKSASKTSSLEVWNTKPDTPGKLKALKTQLEKKKKSLPTAKSYKTMKKRQEEVAKLEEEVNRLEKLFNKEKKQQEGIDREFDEMDVEAYDVIMEGMAEEIAEEEGKRSSEVDDLTFTNKNREKTQVQPSGKEKSEAKEIINEEVSEGEESTVFEEMTLRELLQSDDPEAQDEIKERKTELTVNPKKLYQEMKQALKDEELTKEEAEFYDNVVRKARAETDMSEKHEDMLININNEIWKKTHNGIPF